MIEHALSMFEAENRSFHKHTEAQLKKVRAYKKAGFQPQTWLVRA